MVLVIPQSVLISHNAVEYHPYLHQFPDTFSSLIQFLKQVGVKNELDIKHMQMVLESAHKCTDGKEMDPNTKNYVAKAVKFN